MWIFAEYLMGLTLFEALPIIEDAKANGFEFKIENCKLYYREFQKV